VDAFMCYKQKCKVVSLNLAHPVDSILGDTSRSGAEKVAFDVQTQYLRNAARSKKL